MSTTEIVSIYRLRGLSDAEFRTLVHLERYVGTGFLNVRVETLAEALEVNPEEAAARVRALCKRGVLAPLARGQRASGAEDTVTDCIYGSFHIIGEMDR